MSKDKTILLPFDKRGTVTHKYLTREVQMGQASEHSRELQSIMDIIGINNITQETRQQLSGFSENFQSYVDTHGGNFREESSVIQSVKDQIESSNLTKELRKELQIVQRSLQSRIDQSRP